MPREKRDTDAALRETSHKALNAHDLGPAGRVHRPLDKFTQNPEFTLAREALQKAKITEAPAILAAMRAYADALASGDTEADTNAEEALIQAIVKANETLPEENRLFHTDRVMLIAAIRDFGMSVADENPKKDIIKGDVTLAPDEPIHQAPSTIVTSPATRIAPKAKKGPSVTDSGAIEGEEFDPKNFAHYLRRSENLASLIKAYRACDVVTDPLQATNLEGMMRDALEKAGAPENRIGDFVEMVRNARTLDSIATPRPRAR